MNLNDTLLGEAWYWTAWAVWLPLFALSLWRAPWARLKDGELLNVWLGMVVMLTLLWSLKAGVKPGLNLHLLGAMAATLAGADTLVVYLAALASAALGAVLAFVVVGNMGSGVPVAPLMPQVPYAGQQYAPPGTGQQYAPPAPPVAQSLAPQAGFCSECGETVWLTPNGNCTRGHGPECISNRYTPST